ncbi:MAG: diacylglycerol/lipid kinase family protein [Chloroflexota bacterium]
MQTNRDERELEGPREAALIVNKLARRGSHYRRAAQAALARAGVQVTDAYQIERARDLPRVTRAALARNRVLIVGGGDGTVSAIVDVLVDTDATLGLLPLGTGNDFARTLGIPLDLEGACRTIAQGHVQAVNLALLNGNYFVNTALIGFGAHVNHTVPNWLKRLTGKGAYALAASFALVRSPSFETAILVDGVRIELRTTLVLVGNGIFHSPAKIRLPAGPGDRDRLIVQAPRDGRKSTMFRLALDVGLRGRPRPDLLMSVSGRDIQIETNPVQEIDIDGEMSGWTPVRATLVPKGLRVFTPAPADEMGAGRGPQSTAA